MADAILGATVQVLLGKALSLVAIDTIDLVRGFKKDLILKELEQSVKMTQAFLTDAEDKQTRSRAVQEWLERLKEVAFDAYVVLDELNYKSLRRKVKSRNLIRRKVGPIKDDLSFRLKMDSRVRDINTKLKNINQKAQKLELAQKVPERLSPTTAVAPSRETDSLAAPYVVGRESDESEIVKILLSPSEKAVSVLPIVGMPGLGKTTLVKSVYNNQEIHGHFHKKIWVCVSEKFEVLELFKRILGSLTRKGVEYTSRDVVVQEIRKELEGKRYLLVLDDVWNTNQKLWDDFFDSLVGITTAHGNKCLVTTRLQAVTSIVSPHHEPYPLAKLSDDGCWSILGEKVVQNGEIPEELILIRNQIIKRCGGLPLAANVIGSLLRLQEKEEWRSIVEIRLSNFSEGPENDMIMQTLKVSFDYLPSPYIKKCFTYCSLFSKDATIDRDLLIELWMAEGFLQTDLQNKMTMEEIGGRYLDILVQSSLLENVEGRKNYCKIHDLVHDLTQSLSKLKRFDSENDEINNCADRVRYLAFGTSAEIMSLNDTSALILNSSSISEKMLLKFKHLHTLNLSKANIRELPSSVGKLKHLRFLAISSSEIKSLPESVCKLYNLQTLRMAGCNNIGGLPQGMNNLISLRHLHFCRNGKIKMPLEMGRLTSLQTLEFFNVGEELGRHIDELGPLKFLKGKLRIRNLELVKGKEGAERAKLSGKQNLRKLKFCWGQMLRPDAEFSNDENVLDGLKPHENLEALTIDSFMGSRLPHWLSNLSKLVKLKLNGCNKCKELPPLGHLPSLEYLSLEGLDGLTTLRSLSLGSVLLDEFQHFPALASLRLDRLGSIEALPDWLGNLASLEQLWLRNCAKLRYLPSMPALRRLTKLRHVEIFNCPLLNENSDRNSELSKISQLPNLEVWIG